MENGIALRSIFNLFDISFNGRVTVSCLVAALQSAAPGSTARPSPEERELRARQEIRSDLAPRTRYVRDLRVQIRTGLKWGEPGCAGPDGDAGAESAGDAGFEGASGVQGKVAAAAPRAKPKAKAAAAAPKAKAAAASPKAKAAGKSSSAPKLRIVQQDDLAR